MQSSAPSLAPAPLFSFLIVHYRTLALTRAAIVSIQRHAAQFHPQIIVVDNRSADGSIEQLQFEFPQVDFVLRDDNGGYPVGCNAGAKLARAPWLILLNSDAELLPETMTQVARLLESHRNIGILGGQLLNTDMSLQNSVQGQGRRFEQRNQHIDSADVTGVVGAFMMIRKDLWDDLGGMDEKFFFFFEESDLCRRALQNGARIVWSPKVRILHHLSKSVSGIDARLRSRIEYWKSYYYFQRKHLSGYRYWLWSVGCKLRLWVNLCGQLVALVCTLGLSSTVRRRVRVYLHCVLWHARGCPASWGFRRS
ncbi:MAG TPA: glycosyltransferase family 2 protein [Candidatus Saccharimonadales bacterium]|nr:glycosyltransferase family 2 protein [Candidatus Saccharimonadales bacterium]